MRQLTLFPLLLGLALSGEAQEPKPETGSTFPSAVGLVRVDVVVTDKQGRAVTDLRAFFKPDHDFAIDHA